MALPNLSLYNLNRTLFFFTAKSTQEDLVMD